MTDPDLAAWDEASGTGVLCIVEECSHREQVRECRAQIAQLRKALDVAHAKLAEFAAVVGTHDEWDEYVAGPTHIPIPGRLASGHRLTGHHARKKHGKGTSDVEAGELEIAP